MALAAPLPVKIVQKIPCITFPICDDLFKMNVEKAIAEGKKSAEITNILSRALAIANVLLNEREARQGQSDLTDEWRKEVDEARDLVIQGL